MFPSFKLFGFLIPTYYFVEALDLIGFIFILVLLLAFKFKLSFGKIILIVLLCVPLPFVNLFVVGYVEELIRSGSSQLGNQDYFGFLTMLIPMVLIAAKVTRVSERTIFSAFAPACAFGGSFIKIGCLSVGCGYCRGVETGGWGVRYPDENVTRIPVEIYEMVFLAILFVRFLLLVIRSKKPTYAPFLVFFFSFPVYRFIQDFWRKMPDYFFGLNFSQVNAIVLLTFVLLAAIYLSYKERKEEAKANPKTH